MTPIEGDEIRQRDRREGRRGRRGREPTGAGWKVNNTRPSKGECSDE